MQEAVDPPAEAAIVTVEQPPLEWYAEYIQTSASESATVRLSGHRAPFNETRSTLEELGFSLDDLSLQQWQGAGGSAQGDPASPTVVVLNNGPTTLMLLSYEQDLDPAHDDRGRRRRCRPSCLDRIRRSDPVSDRRVTEGTGVP